MFNVIHVSPVSVSFESDEDRPYYAGKPFDVKVNGQFCRSEEKNVFTIFGLKPSEDYEFDIDGQILKVRTLDVRRIVDVKQQGAHADGKTLDTELLQKILDESDNDLIVFEKGDYYTGPLNIRSNTYLYLEKDACLIGSKERSDYPIIRAYNEDKSAVNASWEGEPNDAFMSLITSFDSENIMILGEGTINGNADKADWWVDPLVKRGAWRGNNVFVNRCKNVSFVGLNIINSPSWNLHPFYSKDLDFIDLTLRSIPTSPNTDGFDPESCKNTRLLGTRIYVGDDCVAIKSGKKIMADDFYCPTEDLVIRNCFMGDGHGGVVFGSESSCGIRNVEVSRCIFKNTDRGLRIKTKRGRGNKSNIENISFDNILMDGVMSCLVVNMYYYLSRDAYDPYADTKEYVEPDERTPHIGTFNFKNLNCLNTKVCAGYFYGLPESKIDKIILDHINVTFDKTFTKQVAPAMIYDCEKLNNAGFCFYNVKEVETNEVLIEGVPYRTE